MLGPFKIISMSGGAVLGMTSGRTVQFAKRTPCHTQTPQSMIKESPTAVMNDTNVPSNEKVRRGKANMNQAVLKLDTIKVKKPTRKAIDFSS